MENRVLISDKGTTRLNVDEVNPMERRIIENNNVPKLVPMMLQQIDDWVTISYDLAGKTSLQKLQKTGNGLTVEIGVNILKNLLQEIKRLEEYMLLPANMVLEPEYIFLAGQLQKVEFLYVPYSAPDTKGSVEDSVKAVLAFIYQGIYMQPHNVVRDMRELMVSQEFSLIKLQKVLDDYISMKNMDTYIPEEPVIRVEPSEVPIQTKEKGKRKKERKKKEKKQVIKSTDEKKLRKNRLLVVFLAVMALILVIDLSQSVEISVCAGLVLAMVVFMIWRRMGKTTVQADESVKKAAVHETSSKDTNKERSNIDVFGRAPKPIEELHKQKEKKGKEKEYRSIQDGLRIPGVSIKDKNEYTSENVQSGSAVFSFSPQENNSAPVIQERNTSFGETTLLSSGGIGETTLLNETATALRSPSLKVIKTGQRYNIDKAVYRIGYGSEEMDCSLTHNHAVSRHHADIIMQQGNYYIRDNYSKNHTYVEGRVVSPQETRKLENGTKIRLANEELVFYF